MRAEHTRYEVAAWGAGDLWTAGGVLLAHELSFDAGPSVSDTGSKPRSAATRRVPAENGVPGCRERSLGAGTAGGATVIDSARVALDSGQCLTPPELVARFVAFFDGDDPRLEDVAIDLEWATPFQRAVATTLRGVPRGEVVSYGELAALAGYPGAGRAVGTFCAHNRFMLVVPCHRVVGASGLGGYGSAGLAVKRRLLALEGASA